MAANYVSCKARTSAPISGNTAQALAAFYPGMFHVPSRSTPCIPPAPGPGATTPWGHSILRIHHQGPGHTWDSLRFQVVALHPSMVSCPKTQSGRLIYAHRVLEGLPGWGCSRWCCADGIITWAWVPIPAMAVSLEPWTGAGCAGRPFGGGLEW